MKRSAQEVHPSYSTDARLARLVQEAYGWPLSRIFRDQARSTFHGEMRRGDKRFHQVSEPAGREPALQRKAPH